MYNLCHTTRLRSEVRIQAEACAHRAILMIG